MNSHRHNFISSNWSINNNDYKKSWGFTELDRVHAEMSVIHLMGDWPFNQSGKKNDALANRLKKNFVDSLSYKIHYDEEMTLEMGHLELGKYYEKRGEYRQALKEYIALTYQMPNANAFYEPAVKLLSKTRNYVHAIHLLKNALKYHKSTLIYSWIGQFSTAIGEQKQAVKFLELGITDRPKDILVLNSLAISYYSLNMVKKGDQIVRTLELINPSLTQIEKLKRIRTSITSNNK